MLKFSVLLVEPSMSGGKMPQGSRSLKVVTVLAIATTASKVDGALVQNSLVVVKDAKGSVMTFWRGVRVHARFAENKLWRKVAGGEKVLLDPRGEYTELFDFTSTRPSFEGTTFRVVKLYGAGERTAQYRARSNRLVTL